MPVHHGRLPRAFPQPAPTPERRNLDRERVVRAALELLDEVGLDGLTMRRLAEKLGVKAASLYWHVHDKEELLDLLAEAISSEIVEPPAGLPWRESVVLLMRQLRRVLLAHRDAALILEATLPLGPNRLRLMEAAASIMLNGGFVPRDAAFGAYLLNDYVTQFVIEEGRPPAIAMSEGITEQEIFTDMQSFLANLPADTYPSIVQLSQYLGEPDATPRFEFGMNVILDGLEQRLSAGDGTQDNTHDLV